MRKLSAMLALMMLVALVVGCSGGGKIPDAEPLPAGQNFAGVWFSPQFEHMFLRQQGDEIHGVYTYKYGGTLEGTADGNLLEFKWIDPGSKSEARRSLDGNGWLQMYREGDLVKLRGEWGYNDARTGGGIWEAEYVRPMDADDPRSIEEWREQQGIE